MLSPICFSPYIWWYIHRSCLICVSFDNFFALRFIVIGYFDNIDSGIRNMLRMMAIFVSLLRIAKRKMDNCNYCGGVLHVFYAPEYETIDDTRSKLQQRRMEISRRIRQLEAETDGNYNQGDTDFCL